MLVDGRQTGALDAEWRVNARGAPDVFAPADFVRVGPGRNGGGGGGGAIQFAKILAKAGDAPPYLYTAVQVAHDGNTAFDADHWDPVPGGISMSGTLINLQEIGAAGEGVMYLPVGAIVGFWCAGRYYACSVSHYRGTFNG